MRRVVFLVVLCTAVSGVARPACADDWKQVEEKHGIAIYRRKLPGSGVVEVKGVGTIEAPLWKIASILLDTARAPEWVDSLKESRMVRRLGPQSYIEYNHLGMPFIIQDREFVSQVRIDVDSTARSFALVYRPTDDAAVPPTHYVRGEILAGRFQAVSLVPDRRTELTAEVQADLKGLLPAWVVNFFQRSWPLTTFEAVRKQAAKPDIGMPAEFRNILEPTLGF
jgi:hypothetical protein